VGFFDKQAVIVLKSAWIGKMMNRRLIVKFFKQTDVTKELLSHNVLQSQHWKNNVLSSDLDHSKLVFVCLR